MTTSKSSKILIIGMGNPYRCDDGVGRILARRLKEESLEGVRVVEQSGEGAALMEAWKNAEIVILIDAVDSGGKPGTLQRFDVNTQPLPTQFFHYSTHAFSIAEAVELARALNALPPQLIVYGIEGKNFQMGVGLTPEVEKAASEVKRRILKEARTMVKENYEKYENGREHYDSAAI